jgi:hypothetical protein
MAELLDVSIEIYDWARRYQFVTLLRRPGSSALVVGHSNTITERVDLLGGESGGEIDEVSEHDRRYILTVHEPGKVNTKLIRYGTDRCALTGPVVKLV